MKKMGYVFFLLACIAVGLCLGFAIMGLARKPSPIGDVPGPGVLPAARGFTLRITAENFPSDFSAGAFEAMQSIHASSVLLIVDSPPHSCLIAMVPEARARNLQVFLALAPGNTPITPAAYAARAKELCAHAKSLDKSLSDDVKDPKVYGIVLGLGLDSSFADDEYWKTLFRSLRDINASAKYMYVASVDDYPSVGWWDSADMIGVSGSFNLPANENADIPQIRNAWRTSLEELCTFSSRMGRPAALVDVGLSEKLSPPQRTRHLQALLQESRDRPELQGLFLRGWSGKQGAELRALSNIFNEAWSLPAATAPAASMPEPDGL